MHSSHDFLSFFLFFFFGCVYRKATFSFFKYSFIFERGGGAERWGAGGQRTPSRLCTDSRELQVGLELTNSEIMT